MHPLLLDQLAEVDDDGLLGLEEAREPGGVALVGQPLLGVAGVRRVVPRLLERAPRARARAAPGPTRRRRRPAAPRPRVARGRRPPRGRCGCAPSRRRSRARSASASAPQAESSALPRIEYSSSEPCALTANGAPVAAPDRPTEEDVVREDDVGGQERAERRRVRVDPAVELVPGAILDPLHVVALVAVDHERGQQPADVGSERLRGAEVVPLRLRLLREHDDVVAGAAPLAREHARVDVRARAAEQVAVPEEDAHPAEKVPGTSAREAEASHRVNRLSRAVYVRWKYRA